MCAVLDIHTHHEPPEPEAVISVSPEEFNPVEGQLYSVGIHPWRTTEDISDAAWTKLEEALGHPQVVALGECGIDLLKGGPTFRQMLVFKRQVELSEKVGKPLVIHCVHGHDLVIGMKKDLKPTQNWAVHGFRGKPTVADMFIRAGIWLSFGPVYNHKSLCEVPEDMLLAETDESPVEIVEVITGLSALSGHDLTDVIKKNSTLFLGMETSGRNQNQ